MRLPPPPSPFQHPTPPTSLHFPLPPPSSPSQHTVPEGVLPPTLTPLSPFEIQVNWTEPLIPNGIITRYGLYMVSVDMATLPSRFLLLSPSEPGSLVVEQLQPFTQYGFQLEACTIVGCSDSDNVTSFTLESGKSASMYIFRLID